MHEHVEKFAYETAPYITNGKRREMKKEYVRNISGEEPTEYAINKYLKKYLTQVYFYSFLVLFIRKLHIELCSFSCISNKNKKIEQNTKYSFSVQTSTLCIFVLLLKLKEEKKTLRNML